MTIDATSIPRWRCLITHGRSFLERLSRNLLFADSNTCSVLQASRAAYGMSVTRRARRLAAAFCSWRSRAALFGYQHNAGRSASLHFRRQSLVAGLSFWRSRVAHVTGARFVIRYFQVPAVAWFRVTFLVSHYCVSWRSSRSFLTTCSSLPTYCEVLESVTWRSCFAPRYSLDDSSAP